MALIVGIEGLPGCGKTTVIHLMIQKLHQEGLRAVIVDIDTSPFAPALRAAADTMPMGSYARSILFWAMRIIQYDVIRTIQEIQHDIDIIFADRSWGSALAFDGCGNGISLAFLTSIGQELGPPDITFLFHAPLEVARARKDSQTMRDLDFARRVEQGYAKLGSMQSWILVDATRSPQEMRDECLAIIFKALKKECAS